MNLYLFWFQEHLLAVISVVLTIVLIYHYLSERDTGIKLSKRYRNSIFEAQSKIFLNATQYLISGNKDLAIKEFLNAVDLNRETIETYFALGGLFRSNGEIEKAISIHRSLIARESISEGTRLKALKELALDYDKGGFVEEAIKTYKEALKMNRDQHEVILSLCRIFEDVEDWDEAYRYRIMLTKVSHENQAETISHILVQKALMAFKKGDFAKAQEELEDAFRFAPSVSAKILQLKISLVKGNMDSAKLLLIELLKGHPMYASFIFVSLAEKYEWENEVKGSYEKRLQLLREFFLNLDDDDLRSSASVILSKIRLLKEGHLAKHAHDLLSQWMKNGHAVTEVLKIEYIKLLLDLNLNDEALNETKELLENLNKTLTRHFCSHCGYNSDNIFWRCPQCHRWETIQFRWKV